jgi:hypothetical protein
MERKFEKYLGGIQNENQKEKLYQTAGRGNCTQTARNG